MNKEVEIDFLEPTLAILITNLEEIENDLFLNSKIKTEFNFSNLIDQLNDVENIEQLEEILLQFDNIKEQVIKTILENTETDDRFELIYAFFLAIEAASLLNKNSFLFNHIQVIEELISQHEINDELDVFENYKIVIINLINDNYARILNVFEADYPKSSEFYKVMQIATNEKNLNDLREASKLLISILKINFDFNSQTKMKQLNNLIKCEVLINLIDLWSEFELVDDDLWA